MYFQQRLRNCTKCPDAKVAALQLYSDKTQLAISQGLSAHPIRATLLNIAYGKRIKSLVDVGYLPEIQPPPGKIIPEAAWRRVKLHFMNKCLSLLLKTAKEASFTGIRIKVRAMFV